MPIQHSDYSFTHAQIREKLNNWTLEPFTQDELDNINRNLSTSNDPITYGENDIESLILELSAD